ncbi:MAG: DMT family protein [Synergistaceae bacterium]
MIIKFATPIILLLISNVFMTYAWYGHLKHMGSKPLIIAIVISWLIAFFEYCFQVPANRLGNQIYTLPQLKIIQEVITMTIFAGFSYFIMKEKLTLNYLWATLCMVGAVFFIFKQN